MPLMLLEFLRTTRLIDELHGLGELCCEAGILAKDSALIRHLEGALGHHRIALFRSQPTNEWDHNTFLQILNVRAAFQLEGGLVQLKPGASPDYLLQNIVNFFSTEASDPRDKIYAFLGLSKEFTTDDRSWANTSLNIEPNYKLSIREVYINATAFMAVTGKNLKILSLVQDEAFRKQSDLPSWVPDFSGQNYPNAIDDGGPIPWNASEGLGSLHISFPSPGVLNVHGHHVGDALELVDFDIKDFTHLGEITNFLKGLPKVSRIPGPPTTQALRDYILNGETHYPEDFEGRESRLTSMLSTRRSKFASSAQSRIEVLWRTLLTDRFQGFYPAPDTCKAAVFHMIQESINKIQIQIAQSFVAGDSSNVKEKLTALAIKCKSWKELQSLDLDNLHPTLPSEFTQFMRALDKSLYPSMAVIALRDQLDRKLVGMDRATTAEVKRRMVIGSYAKKLFRMNTGHLGNGPKSMRVGDQVWLLAGASMPFLLRPVDGGRYRLIGEVFVHGIMHGEAVPDSGSAISARVISLI